ncbi:unnamed protein product [Boreogadus saida]
MRLHPVEDQVPRGGTNGPHKSPTQHPDHRPGDPVPHLTVQVTLLVTRCHLTVQVTRVTPQRQVTGPGPLDDDSGRPPTTVILLKRPYELTSCSPSAAWWARRIPGNSRPARVCSR